jgi:hypothetical protein
MNPKHGFSYDPGIRVKRPIAPCHQTGQLERLKQRLVFLNRVLATEPEQRNLILTAIWDTEAQIGEIESDRGDND